MVDPTALPTLLTSQLQVSYIILRSLLAFPQLTSDIEFRAVSARRTCSWGL